MVKRVKLVDIMKKMSSIRESYKECFPRLPVLPNTMKVKNLRNAVQPAIVAHALKLQN